MNLDSFAHIPLAALIIALLAIIVFVVIITIRKTAKTSFVFLLSLVCIFVGAVYTFMYQNIFVLTLALFASAALLLPYCIIKATSSPEEDNTNEKGLFNATKKSRSNIIYEDKYIDLLDINKDFMVHTSDSFIQKEGLNQLLEYFSKKLIELANADGAAILLVDDFDDLISVKNATGSFPPPYKLPENVPLKQQRIEMSFKYAQFPLSGNIFGEIASNGKPELITEPLKDSRIVQNGTEDFLKCGSYIFIPLTVSEVVIGEIALSKNFDSPAFTNNDFESAKKLADFVSAAIRTRNIHSELVEHSELAKEGEIALRVQKSLLPPKLPVIPGMSLGVYFDPAENICGDYYDVLVSRKDRISFILADVAGKSINSLVIMLMIRAMLRLIINTTQSAGTILSWTNRGIATETSVDHFASCSLLIYDSISKKVQFSSGGTNRILRYSVDTGLVENISKSFEPIGVEKTTNYEDTEISVKKGDILVVCTDGLIESLNSSGNQYSEKSLEKVIKEHHNLSGKDIANFIKNDVVSFCGTAAQYDDRSLLVIKIQ